ncbi:MAG: Flp pilus assembly complex ATPase component TadA [Pirellulales bacterium]|nr:Flp pilus assembly complex ATPase component TadA [Pirellulales bacterium]
MEAGQILRDHGLLDDEQLDVLRDSASDGERIDRLAIQKGMISEEEALGALGEALGLEYVDLANYEFDPAVLEDFPVRIIYRHGVLPLRRRSGTLVVATSDPFELYALDEVSAATGTTVEPVLAASAEIAKLIKTHLGVASETIEGLLAKRQEEAVELLEELDIDGSEQAEAAQEASVVRLVNEILVEAIEARASDIHIEAQAKGLKIRYRIDGILQTQPAPPEINHFQAAIVSRLKIMAKLNIAEKRLPQDGRIKLKVSGREVDIRVSIIPMIHGEGIVMRVLDKDKMNFNLAGVGLPEDIYRQFHQLIQLPHGILLVTGPTGSGKTTTLYSALAEIRDDATKIITTEDPVEYQLEGINQIQVQAKIGLTFAASLRGILRHDPDVVLVGEIRDLETAENAVQASLTGHLVFSTLHTNDAAGAYMRLCDMGVEPFLVSSTVEGVMAQRLVRTLCADCKRPFVPEADEVPNDFPLAQVRDGKQTIYAPGGCKSCRGSGYRGRVGLFELLVANDEIRHLANERTASHVVKAAAVRGGMRSLRQDGWRLVFAGRTSIDEVMRVTKAD